MLNALFCSKHELIENAHQVEEIVIDYTDCIDSAPSGKNWSLQTFGTIPSSKVRTSFSSGSPKEQPRWQTVNQTAKGQDEPDRICTLEFEIPNNLPPPVFFYYRLTNFYQNHRRYVKSVDERQLKGEAVPLKALEGSDSSCSPLISDEETKKPYYPCGLIANSLFNDTFSHPLWVTTNNGANDETYFMTDKGIAWESDRDRYKKSKYSNSDVMPPPNWRKQYPDGYTDKNPIPDLSQREDFQVWMRTAGLPTFSKLARKNTTEPMLKGTYYVNITDSALPSLLCYITLN